MTFLAEHKITIITINKNNKSGLIKTIDSVISQTYKEYEYIIVDGASTDGSTEVYSKYPRIDKFLSEADSGIYNAMNKGIHLSHGEYCLFLNSGDCLYHQDVLAQTVQILKKTDSDIISFRLMLPKNDSYFPKNHYNFINFQPGCIPHQATLIRCNLFQRIGEYREDYRLVSDFIFFFNALCLQKVSFAVFDLPFCLYDLNGLSSDHTVVDKEINRFLREKEVPYIYRFIMFLRKIRNMVHSHEA